MLVNRKYDKATILIIAAGLLAYASFQPKFRLRTALPREFIDESSSWPAEKRVSEEKVARAYWNCAVTQIQWKYGYGHRLPQDLPLEFAVSTEELGPTADDQQPALATGANSSRSGICRVFGKRMTAGISFR